MVNPKDIVSCQEARAWLFTGSSDLGEDVDERELQRHLRGCQECRAYERTLTRVRSELDEHIPAGLQPDPAIQDRLRATLRKRGSLVSGLQVLQRPVPAYQAVLGAAAAMVAVLIIDNSNPVEKRADAPSENPRSEFIAVDSRETINQLRKIKKGGRTHAEDSLLVGKTLESFAAFDGAGEGG